MKNKPAFPCEVEVNKERTEFQAKQIGNNTFLEHGITIRDYFAGKALIGLILNNVDSDFQISDACKIAAELSYKIADEMMEARK